MKKKKESLFVYSCPNWYIKEEIRKMEIGKCYATEGTIKAKMGHVVITRIAPDGTLVMGVYMIDLSGSGLRFTDCILDLSSDNFMHLLDTLSDDKRKLEEISYELAHNLIYGAIDYAEEIGIEPPKAWQLTQYVLKEDTDDVPLMEFELGVDGHHIILADTASEAQYFQKKFDKLGVNESEYVIVNTDEDE